MRICKKCNVEKPLDEFKQFNYKGKPYQRTACKSCNVVTPARKDEFKRWRDANREHLRATNKRWRSENAKAIQENRNKRYRTEPLFKLRRCLRARVLEAFKVNKWLKTGKHAEILGCTYEEAKAHLEKQFIEGMTWSNHGNGEGKWNIDHIIPLDTAKTPDDLIGLNHYSNLQPLWWKNNLMKGNKI